MISCSPLLQAVFPESHGAYPPPRPSRSANNAFARSDTKHRLGSSDADELTFLQASTSISRVREGKSPGQHRQRRMIRKDGADTLSKGSNGQPVFIPEITDAQHNQQLLLSMLKSIR